jgi:hypothetical protein
MPLSRPTRRQWQEWDRYRLLVGGSQLDTPWAESISATLESIRRQIEEGSGKVKTPPPPEGVEPHPETNPAVVDEDS